MLTVNKSLVISVLLSWGTLSAPAVYANVPVVDLTQATTPPPAPVSQPAAVEATDSTALATETPGQVVTASPLSLEQRVTILQRQMANLTQLNLLGQLNQLQQDLEKLRGQLEVQGHDIQQLKEQLRTQYQDLDDRLAKVTPKPATVSKIDAASATSALVAEQNLVSKKPVSSAQKQVQSATSTATLAEQSAYKSATDLIKKGDFVRASTALQKLLRTYPDGQHAVDAHYWLGEIYLAQGQPDLAVGEFHTVVTNWPNHAKIPNAIYKLGVSYADKGDTAKAQVELRKVLKQYPKSSAAQLAKTRLQSLKSTK